MQYPPPWHTFHRLQFTVEVEAVATSMLVMEGVACWVVATSIHAVSLSHRSFVEYLLTISVGIVRHVVEVRPVSIMVYLAFFGVHMVNFFSCGYRSYLIGCSGSGGGCLVVDASTCCLVMIVCGGGCRVVSYSGDP